MELSNRFIRILVAVIAIPFLIFASYYGKWVFLIFVMIIALFAFSEFSKMVEKKGIYVAKHLGLVIVNTLVLNTYFKTVEPETIILASVIIVILFELFRNNGSAIQNIGATLLAIFYPGLLTTTLIQIREFYGTFFYVQGGLLIISILVTLWVIDSAAYFIGTAIGKHRLFVRVSPKKSWEGAVAGFVFGIISIIVLREYLITFLSIKDSLIIGVIIGIFGQIGDLSESLMKRDADVKDSSNIIPGHGGIFDRFDSLIFASPFVLIYLKHFAN